MPFKYKSSQLTVNSHFGMNLQVYQSSTNQTIRYVVCFLFEKKINQNILSPEHFCLYLSSLPTSLAILNGT